MTTLEKLGTITLAYALFYNVLGHPSHLMLVVGSLLLLFGDRLERRFR